MQYSTAHISTAFSESELVSTMPPPNRSRLTRVNGSGDTLASRHPIAHSLYEYALMKQKNNNDEFKAQHKHGKQQQELHGADEAGGPMVRPYAINMWLAHGPNEYITLQRTKKKKT